MLSSVEIAALKGGTAYDLIYDNVDVLYSVTYNSLNWSAGTSSGLSSVSQLKADSVAGGTWEVPVAVGYLADVINAGVHLTYWGSGVTMEYSLDGTVWTVATNAKTVLEGTNVAGSILFIRLTLANDQSYVDALTVDLLRNRTMAPYSGFRDLTFTKTAMDQTPAHQSTLGPDDGADIDLGGYLEIQPDVTTVPVTVKTVEFWLKKNGTQNSIILETPAGRRLTINNTVLSFNLATVSVNGVAAVSGTTTIPLNTWVFISMVFTTAANELIRIGSSIAGASPSDINVYGLALYTATPTGTYQANTTVIGTRVDDASVITMTENVPAVDIYAYTWTNGGT